MRISRGIDSVVSSETINQINNTGNPGGLTFADLNTNMKSIVLPLLCGIALISIMATSCSVTYDPPAIVILQTDLVKMPSFLATVVRIENGNVVNGGNQVDANFVAATLTTTNGGRICIGGPNASPEMVAFIRGLHKRQICMLPEAFIAFQKSQTEKKP